MNYTEQIQTLINNQRDKLGITHTIGELPYDSLVDAFLAFTEQFSDKPAFSSLGYTLSFTELEQKSRDFAAWLQHRSGLNPGDRVAIQLPNILQYPIVLFGILRAGMVVVNTNPLYTEREMQHQFEDAGIKALVVLDDVAEKSIKVAQQVGVEKIITVTLAGLHPTLQRWFLNIALRFSGKGPKRFDLDNVFALTEVLDEGERLQHTDCPIKIDDIAVLQYTGGTTGVAKGVMLTHRNLLANTFQSKEMFKTYGFEDGKEIMVQPLPLYHIYAFILSMIVLSTGNHTVLIPDPRNMTLFMRELARWKFTGMCGLNTLFVGLCNNKKFQELDFSSLKMTLSGGMALTTKAAEDWEKVTGTIIYEGYGLTETSPVVSVNPGGAHELGTIGLALPDTDLCLKDYEGNFLPPNETGELCVRGPQVMKGYWNRPEDTKDVIDADGWLHTGDIGQILPNGYGKIVDRKKDMILVSGFNVYPNEIENIVTQHPGVLECAVIGVPDTVTGESVKLFVVKKEGFEDLTGHSIDLWLKDQLSGYKRPSFIEFRQSLPKSAVGKILKKELRDN